MSHYEKRSHSYAGRTSVSPSRGQGRGYYTRPSYTRSASSLFGGSAHSDSHPRSNSRASSSRGLFGVFSSGGGASSHYKRRPRDGYIAYLLHRLQRMVRELWHYARRHPVKAFFAVIVPLLSAGGAVHGLLKQFGVRLPMMDGAARRGGGGYYGSSGYSSSSGLGGFGGENSWMGGAGSLMQIAKAFM